MSVQEYFGINQTSDASLLAIIVSMTVSHTHTHTHTHTLTHAYNGHPSLHSWPPFMAALFTRTHTYTHRVCTKVDCTGVP